MDGWEDGWMDSLFQKYVLSHTQAELGIYNKNFKILYLK